MTPGQFAVFFKPQSLHGQGRERTLGHVPHTEVLCFSKMRGQCLAQSKHRDVSAAVLRTAFVDVIITIINSNIDIEYPSILFTYGVYKMLFKGAQSIRFC